MKFKEIKPGMVIHCQKKEDKIALSQYLMARADLDFTYTEPKDEYGDFFYVSDIDGDPIDVTNDEITEFSDLIEPDENLANKANDLDNQQDNEMSAVEVLEWLHNVDADTIYKVFGISRLDEALAYYEVGEIIQKITAYEATKKASKPVEVEWVDVVRIIKIGDMGRSVCVCERDIIGATDDDLVKQGVEIALREYIAEHEGEYFAVHQKQCRVKEGES